MRRDTLSVVRDWLGRSVRRGTIMGSEMLGNARFRCAGRLLITHCCIQVSAIEGTQMQGGMLRMQPDYAEAHFRVSDLSPIGLCTILEERWKFFHERAGPTPVRLPDAWKFDRWEKKRITSPGAKQGAPANSCSNLLCVGIWSGICHICSGFGYIDERINSHEIQLGKSLRKEIYWLSKKTTGKRHRLSAFEV
ncbi:hypothetical protein BDZ91DRAFT_433116 [Kalaharituber pfeilii]|nr:hypothetical protein BDZ91DRAFT_433116 [Kalaharituber pfeilii]